MPLALHAPHSSAVNALWELRPWSTLFGSFAVSTTAWSYIQQRRQLQLGVGVKRERLQHLLDVILRRALHHHPGLRPISGQVAGLDYPLLHQLSDVRL